MLVVAAAGVALWAQVELVAAAMQMVLPLLLEQSILAVAVVLVPVRLVPLVVAALLLSVP
jgi:hypothetical protein